MARIFHPDLDERERIMDRETAIATEKEMEDTSAVSLVWEMCPSFVITCVLVGPLFNSTVPKVLFGTTDGTVRVYSNKEVI